MDRLDLPRLSAEAANLRRASTYSERVDYVLESIRQLLSPSLPNQSSWHPYGFLQVKLYEDQLGAVRLHVWPEMKRPRQVPDWPVHNHRYTLDSHLLLGEVTNEVYRVDLQTKRSAKSLVLYQASYKEKLSILELTERKVSIHVASRTDFQCGDTYRISEGQFHITYARLKTFVSTLVFTTPSTNSTSYVVGEIGQKEQYIFKRRVCESKTYYSVLKRLEKSLAAKREQ